MRRFPERDQIKPPVNYLKWQWSVNIFEVKCAKCQQWKPQWKKSHTFNIYGYKCNSVVKWYHDIEKKMHNRESSDTATSMLCV